MLNIRYGSGAALIVLFTLWWSSLSMAAEPAPTVSASQRVALSILKDIDKATWFAEGDGKRVVYVFFDPNCPYCHRLFENLRPYLKKGQYQFRWVPVGILTTTSPGKAAAILQAESPVKAFYQNEDSYQRGGGIEEDLIDQDTEVKLKVNADLLDRSQSGAVPMMLYHNKTGSAEIIVGSPPAKRLEGILNEVK